LNSEAHTSAHMAARLSLALVHYPVKGRQGETLASAITNLDLHDIARAAKTYGVNRFYVVTPLEDQKALAGKIVSHWQNGAGSVYNPHRGRALDLVSVFSDIGEAVSEIAARGHASVKIVATSAVRHRRSTGFSEFKKILENPGNEGVGFLLALGTAWGLADEFIEAADYVLAPIYGQNDYNHLSVRSAAAIMLDRLFGDARGATT